MCGICGILASGSGRPGLEDPASRLAMRDALAHRGPDDAGEWGDQHAWLGHRRLAIVDPAQGRQPMVRGEPGTASGETVVVFNGELLNHRELRSILEAEGSTFRTDCDAEVAAEAVHRWGENALDRFRGLFALAWYRPAQRKLVLARDPLGVIPLHHATVRGGVLFASEPVALLRHPGVDASPDPVVVSAYLSTIRITLGARTMFRGVSVLEPGTVARFDLRGEQPDVEITRWWRPPARGNGDDDGRGLREVMAESVSAHLMSDVEVCTLLSGGIDSSAIAVEARRELPNIRSFCATGGDGHADPDRPAARMVAESLGLDHHEIGLADDSIDRWQNMVAAQMLPLGTPNEIAINAIAEGIRSQGVKVALSGEGADEILGGYEPVIQSVLARYLDASPPQTHAEAADWLLGAISFIGPDQKSALLQPSFLEEADGDRSLRMNVTDALASGGEADDPACCLGYLMERNLPGLLGRLNSAMMLASVEARPPFADRRVVEHAAGLSRSCLFDRQADGTVRTKSILRSAYAGALPREVLSRPKASFPVPFTGWLKPVLASSERLERLEQWVRPEVLGVVATDPEAHPLVAWPLANLGIWLESLSGDRAGIGSGR